MLECLDPRSRTCSDRPAASALPSCVASGAGGKEGDVEKRGAAPPPPEDTFFRTHTCWVKAGHDVLHERKPFLMALLHKVRARNDKTMFGSIYYGPP